jgi:drug/metabolite transporter (DMT)-like permease
VTGIWAAIVSSALGGSAAALTRYTIDASDPLTLAAFRFGIGALVILPLAVCLKVKFPRGRDFAAVAGLGILFFCVFFILYNIALSYTSAARGSLALSTLPLATMVVASLFAKEDITARKTAGIVIAVLGVVATLWIGLREAPPEALRGDLLMLAATLCMALYTVWTRPYIARSSALGFLATGMTSGAALSVLLAWQSGGLAAAAGFTPGQWLAAVALGLFGGAAAFYLWNFALERATPTRVANTMTINPVSASLLAALLVGEPLGWHLAVGIGAVALGIWISSTAGPRRARQL